MSLPYYLPVLFAPIGESFEDGNFNWWPFLHFL
uniref:Uncharacterized protein n=1 Tax=Rhizophora mucronata TaxID=61149 RepID=A0A2P2QFT1_RHIMU